MLIRHNRSAIMNFKILSENLSSATLTSPEHQLSSKSSKCWHFDSPYWIHYFEFQKFEQRLVISDLDNLRVPIFTLINQTFPYCPTMMDPPFWILKFYVKTCKATSITSEHQFSSESSKYWHFDRPYWIHYFKLQNFEWRFVFSNLENPRLSISRQ